MIRTTLAYLPRAARFLLRSSPSWSSPARRPPPRASSASPSAAASFASRPRPRTALTTPERPRASRRGERIVGARSTAARGVVAVGLERAACTPSTRRAAASTRDRRLPFPQGLRGVPLLARGRPTTATAGGCSRDVGPGPHGRPDDGRDDATAPACAASATAPPCARPPTSRPTAPWSACRSTRRCCCTSSRAGTTTMPSARSRRRRASGSASRWRSQLGSDGNGLRDRRRRRPPARPPVGASSGIDPTTGRPRRRRRRATPASRPADRPRSRTLGPVPDRPHGPEAPRPACRARISAARAVRSPASAARRCAPRRPAQVTMSLRVRGERRASASRPATRPGRVRRHRTSAPSGTERATAPLRVGPVTCWFDRRERTSSATTGQGRADGRGSTR